MITVYHRNNPDFITHGQFPADYTCVAKVDTGKLEDAFELTQNHERPWRFNKKVTPNNKAAYYRSTSVGDIMVNRFTKVYVVSGTGYSIYKEPTI